MRAVRLWFAPLGVEFPLEIKLKDDDTKLGFSISRTEEVKKVHIEFLSLGTTNQIIFFSFVKFLDIFNWLRQIYQTNHVLPFYEVMTFRCFHT